jgi:hypothetical protein
MNATKSPPEELAILDASEGVGPLLRREYSAVVGGAPCGPEAIGTLLRERFEDFAPPETAIFDRTAEAKDRLAIGDEMEIRIALLGRCRVRVVHHSDCTLTLRTLAGHPEAGRITFGADRDPQGRLRLRIVSRTRASRVLNYLGYLVMGKQLQARCWIRFLERLAEATGGQIADRIHVRTHRVEEEPGDRKGTDAPTFECGRGDD